MRTLPLDHPEPLFATLGVMLYPGEDDESQARARAFAAHHLAVPLRDFHAAGYELPYEQLAQLVSDGGIELDDVNRRMWEGRVVGEIVKTYIALAHTDPSLASWGNATKLVLLCARRQGISASVSSLNAMRSRLMPVAHLWGAYQLRGGQFQSDLSVGYEAWLDLQFFLLESEILLRSDLTWLPEKRGSERPLKIELALRVPSGWLPPEPQPGWPPAGRIPKLTLENELLEHLNRRGRPRKSH